MYLPTEKNEQVSFEHTRPVYVVESLEQLEGPITGEIVLPTHLDWTPLNHYDLQNERELRRLYSTVLTEAKTEEIVSLVNKDKLLKLWTSMRLPRRVRYAWEKTHAILAG